MSELKEQPIARIILEEGITLFRFPDGKIGALENRCPHRFLPLSEGKITSKGLQCGYHGLTFDENGTCSLAPTQDTIPNRANVRAYPVIEHMGLVWVWMGDKEISKSVKVFDLPEYHDSEWGVAFGDALKIDANYLLLCDNLCDPTHVNYVHPTTLGEPDGLDAPVKYKQEEWGVTTSRWTLNQQPVGFFKSFGNFSGAVDRWQIYHMRLPSVAIIDFGSKDVKQDPFHDTSQPIQVFSCHFITPVTKNTSIDYWLHVRNFKTDNIKTGEEISEQFRIAFEEDKIILGLIQEEEEKINNAPRIGLELDASAGLFRRMVEQRIRQEQRLI